MILGSWNSIEEERDHRRERERKRTSLLEENTTITAAEPHASFSRFKMCCAAGALSVTGSTSFMTRDLIVGFE